MAESPGVTFGDWLRDTLKQKRITPQQLAIRISMSVSTVYRARAGTPVSRNTEALIRNELGATETEDLSIHTVVPYELESVAVNENWSYQRTRMLRYSHLKDAMELTSEEWQLLAQLVEKYPSLFEFD